MANRNPIETSADMFMCLHVSHCETDLEKTKNLIIIKNLKDLLDGGHAGKISEWTEN